MPGRLGGGSAHMYIQVHTRIHTDTYSPLEAPIIRPLGKLVMETREIALVFSAKSYHGK